MENKKEEKLGFFDGIGELVKGGFERRRADRGALLFDITVFVIAFLFARCHIVFGTYPLSTALVAFLPRGVWTALFGSVFGALTMGEGGIIYAVISVIVVFLRIIISGGEGKGGEVRAVFGESLWLRISSAAIGAFIGAVYEVLLGGFSLASILYGAVGVVLSAVFTFAFSGITDMDISFSDFVFGTRAIFKRAENEKGSINILLFQASLLLFVFLASISLKEYNFFGISPAYMFSSFVTLFAARRFGVARAVAVGFVSSLGISSTYSVAFALLGLGAGLLFHINTVYALLGGGALVIAWSYYAGGAMGLLSTLPEYVSTALISLPLLRKIKELPEERVGSPEEKNEARDMVMNSALVYRSSSARGLDALECALLGLSGALRSFGEREGVLGREEYREAVIKSTCEFCSGCAWYKECLAITPAPCAENLDIIATKLYKKQRLSVDDPSILPPYCRNGAALFWRLSEDCAALEERRFKNRRMELCAKEYELISKLINETRVVGEREVSVDSSLSEKLSSVLSEVGIEGGFIRALGDRRKHVIGAGRDKDGKIISSPDLRRRIEEAAGIILEKAEFYRSGDYALIECSAAPIYTVEFATVGINSPSEEISGDFAMGFESVDGHFYSLLSDGMGSGSEARKTSSFVADFLSRILNSSCSKTTALHILNHIIREKGEECSATVDLFDLDLLTGEATFFKSGAVASYIKRDSSIFRIRSETAPIGIMGAIDAERIKIEIKSGDLVVMISDGVGQTVEDSAWLAQLLSRPAPDDINEFATLILDGAKKNSKSGDDMTVAVARILSAAREETA